MNYVSDNYNISRYIATINVAEGTYNESLTLASYSASSGYIIILGQSDNVNIIQTNKNVVTIRYSLWFLQRLNIKLVLNDSIIDSLAGNSFRYVVGVYDNGVFGNVGCHIEVDSQITKQTFQYNFYYVAVNAEGGTIRIAATGGRQPCIILPDHVSWEADSICFFRLVGNSLFTASGSNTSQDEATLLCKGTCNWFIIISQSSFTRTSSPAYRYIFSLFPGGTVSGARYNINNGGKCVVAGGGAEYFPGTEAGTVDADTYSFYH